MESEVNPYVAELRRQYECLKSNFDDLDGLIQDRRRFQGLWLMISLQAQLIDLRDTLERFYAVAYQSQHLLAEWDPERMAMAGVLLPSTKLLEDRDIHDQISEEDMREFSFGLEIGWGAGATLGKKLSGKDYPLWRHPTTANWLPAEIEYMLDMLDIVVETDFQPLADSEPDEDDSDPPSRHIPAQVKAEVWRRDEGRCVECQSNELLEYDHIIPHSRGGSNTERNIQLLCERCNRKKGANLA